MERVISVEPLDGYRLQVQFEDGVQGVVDLSDKLWGPVFGPLRASNLFAQASIDEFGVICWPNGADLAPDVLYSELSQDQEQSRLSE